MNTIINQLNDLLVSKGIAELTDLCTDISVFEAEQLQSFIEQKTGIILADSNGNLSNLTDEQIQLIKDCVIENKSYLKDLFSKEYTVNTGATEDVKDARNSQNRQFTQILEFLASQQAKENPKLSMMVALQGLSTNVIALICIVAIFAYQFFVVIYSNDMNTEAWRFVDRSLGSFDGLINTIVGFFFGSAWERHVSNKNK
ncbi:hypothetical protein [uncultured Holdemanella sp.]|uniref:hypothetical protein n=1 Tax=uncultured Holdemanella sp. TaxID=1763549 RepID=UPI0025D5FDB8|nr:hypothetical protein [uncultured Holdemanella sp.]